MYIDSFSSPSTTASVSPDRDALITAIRGFAPRVLAMRDEFDTERRMPDALVQALAEAGLFRLLLPRALGGHEVDPATWMRVVEAGAALDGSLGWTMLGNIAGFFAVYLSEPVARALLSPSGDLLSSGTLNPSGKATVVEGGYRVSGRWPFASGVTNSDFHAAACFVMDGEGPLTDANSAPVMRVLLVPIAEVKVVDTWSVIGLRGTGSHDVEVKDVFVPAERSFSLADPVTQPGPLYAFPVRVLGAAGIASVCLGIARGAIDALMELAGTKSPVGSTSLLRGRAMVQAQVAQAEAMVRSARAYLHEMVSEVWETVLAERPVSLEQRALARLAATHACQSAVQAVELMYTAGGGSALYSTLPLERAFRDVHAASHHFSIQPATFEAAGQVLLGLEPEARFAF